MADKTRTLPSLPPNPKTKTPRNRRPNQNLIQMAGADFAEGVEDVAVVWGAAVLM